MKLPYKTAEEVRQTFLEHFLNREHRYISPSGIMPKDDPTLMFINSGMAPMKPYFTGQATPPYPRLTNVQDCIRFVDFESVGDSYHGTSFRMMGSWSFGDYFKERAIELAFELITGEFGIPADRLYATVFNADDSLPGVPSDEESARIWERFLPRDHIIGRPPEDNFWGPAGTSGPCGPCTEVFFDRGESFAEKETDDVLVPGRHIEIWNAGVFMQYFKDENGAITNLPMKCVDTGAGMERFSMILQDRASIHEIDQYSTSFRLIQESVGDTRWSRIILDHLKTAILMIREGVVPSNVREGYLLRRALRRTMIGAQLHGVELTALTGWVHSLCVAIDNRELTLRHESAVNGWIQSERDSFVRVLQRSKKHLDKIAAAQEISATHAFTLKSELGIPEDLLSEFCGRHGIHFPIDEFQKLVDGHKETSRAKKNA
ncbi:MAG: alanine--tRNA ligase-related protein [Patescibacteria group bacterium]